jgi:AraC-like DNA-binding protein
MASIINHESFKVWYDSSILWYYPPVKREPFFNKRTGTALGQLFQAVKFYEKERWHTSQPSSYTLLYILRGSGVCRDSHRSEFKLERGSLLLMFPETSYSYGPDRGTTWDEFFVSFDGILFRTLQQHGFIHPASPLYSLSPVTPWMSKFSSTLTPPAEKTAAGKNREIATFFLLLIEILETRPSEGFLPQTPVWLYQAKRELGEQLESRMDLHDLAEKFGLSYESFRKRFCEYTGIPPGKYRLERKLEAAIHLLKSTSISMKEISGKLGFYNESHFTDWFKSRLGTSPLAVRRQTSISFMSKRAEAFSTPPS